MRKRTVTPADIGEIVRATRKDAGLRQYELAGVAGVGLRFIVDLEAGKPTAQVGKVLHVLAMLGCSVEIVPPLEPTGSAEFPRVREYEFESAEIRRVPRRDRQVTRPGRSGN